FSAFFGDGFDAQLVQLEQRPGERPVAAVSSDPLRHLGPAGSRAAGALAEGLLHHVAAFLAQQERHDRRGVEDLHSPSSRAASARLSLRSSSTRSRSFSSSLTVASSCSRVMSTRPSGVSRSVRGVPSSRPSRWRTSTGMTKRPRAPITRRYVPLIPSTYHTLSPYPTLDHPFPHRGRRPTCCADRKST